MLDPFELRERGPALLPEGRIKAITFQRKPDEAYSVRIESPEDPATGQLFEIAFNTLMLNPYTGDELPRAKKPNGPWPLTRQNFIRYIVARHYPKDPKILRMAVRHQHWRVGVYASVTRGGTIRRGDRVELEV